MKAKTSELTGAALDWAVAKAAGLVVFAVTERDYGQAAYRPLTRWSAINVTPVGHDIFDPSTNWSQGGPIIEREGITTGPWDTSPARAIKGHNHDWKPTYTMFGPTLLVAGMRCFVASRLGDEVDVPEGLL